VGFVTIGTSPYS